MPMNYQPNSHKYKDKQREEAAEAKEVKKVITGPAKTKKNDIRKFTNTFISEDINNVKNYVISDVLVPTIKKAIVDIVTNGVNMIFWGSAPSSKSGGTKISYSKFYDQKGSSAPWNETKTTTRFDYDDIVYATRGDAEATLVQMGEMIETYGVVTVADMYDMAQLTQPYTSNRYGWTSVARAEVKRIPEGYIIKMPKAMVID